MMKDWLENITRSIVGDEGQVFVDLTENRYQTTLTIRASEADVGKLIGKKCRTINAIRALADRAGERTGTHYNIWVEENVAIAAK